MNAKYAVDILESMPNWRLRLDETKLFDSLEEANLFVRRFNAAYDAASEVSDWHMKAYKPRLVDLDA